MSRASIIIPTSRPPAVLDDCLRAIAGLRNSPREYEVVAVFNGLSELSEGSIGNWPFRLITDRIEEASICAAKNRAIELSSGEWIVLINDDTLLEPDFLNQHIETHRRLNEPAMVLGNSVWATYPDETLFDRMIAQTSMVMFYGRMQPRRWYNFRHAWNLNLSLHRRYAEQVRYDERLRPVNFDDLEWAFRLERDHGLRVWYEPAARSLHDHRYTLEGYLRREEHLGRMAALLWRCNPSCFRAIYGSDLDEGYREFCERFVEVEGRREAESLANLRRIVKQPSADWTLTIDQQDALVHVLYEAHMPLKRLAFRRGLLSAETQKLTPAPSASRGELVTSRSLS